MTSLDEALRALEKEIRGRVPSDTEYVMLGDFERGSVSARRNIADDIAALLTTRQEVAPVAWGLMYPDDHAQRGQLWNVAVEKESAEQMQSACWNAGYDVIVPLYTSTGQTSDARDGARLAGAEERTQLLFDAKNYWADRSRELEARLVALRDEWRALNFEICGQQGCGDEFLQKCADELTALLESKP